MRYRLKLNEEWENDIVIEDIIESEERLLDGYTVRLGTKVKTSMPLKKFFHKLNFSIFKRNSILNIDHLGDVYHIDWIELVNGKVILHRDTFELDGYIPSFVNKIDKAANTFAKVKKKTLSFIGIKVLLFADESDLFMRCMRSFFSYSLKGSIPPVDETTATEMYRLLLDNDELFRSALMPLNKQDGRKIRNIDNRNILTLSAMIASFLLIAKLPLFSITMSILHAYNIRKNCALKEKMLNEYRENVFREAVECLRAEVDEDYLAELNMLAEKKQTPSVSFIDLIEKDLNAVTGRSEFEEVERSLKGFALEYSNDKCATIDGEDSFFDKFSYVMSLLDIELQILNKRKDIFSTLTAEDNVGLEHLYDILAYLGWNKKRAWEDDFLRDVISRMKGILEYPYVWCGIELSQLTEIAILYVHYLDKYSDEHDKAKIDNSLKEMLDRVFETATKKIREIYRLDEESKRRLTAEGRDEFEQALANISKGHKILPIKKEEKK